MSFNKQTRWMGITGSRKELAEHEDDGEADAAIIDIPGSKRAACLLPSNLFLQPVRHSRAIVGRNMSDYDFVDLGIPFLRGCISEIAIPTRDSNSYQYESKSHRGTVTEELTSETEGA